MMVMLVQVLNDLRDGISTAGFSRAMAALGEDAPHKPIFMPLMGPGGVVLDANGNPILGADGRPLVANVRDRGSHGA